ncbi:MAG: hypothetical protein ACK4GL_04080 [Flavobacteriales bacterium]
MRILIFKTLLFISTGIMIIALVCILVYSFVNKGDYYSINTSKSVLIAGHSHPECAYNDSIIETAINLSQSGESYFYMYAKLKPIIRDNPHIKHVFIEYTNNCISDDMIEWMYSNKHLKFRYPKFAAFMSLNDYLLLLRNNFEGTVFATSFSLKNYGSFLASRSSDLLLANEWGHFKPTKLNKVDSLVSSLKPEDYIPFDYKFPEKNMAYLRKSIDMLHQAGIKVFLMRTPQHPKYPGFRNEALFLRTHQEKFIDVPFLDFRNLPMEHYDFADLEHLNTKGANKFSIYVNYLIKQGLLEGKIEPNQVNAYWNAHLELEANSSHN